MGLLVFATGLYLATSGAPYLGSGLTFFGALVSLVGLMGRGREETVEAQARIEINAIKSTDKK